MEFLPIMCSHCWGLCCILTMVTLLVLIWLLKSLFLFNRHIFRDLPHKIATARPAFYSPSPLLIIPPTRPHTPTVNTLENEYPQNCFWTKIKLSINHTYLFFCRLQALYVMIWYCLLRNQLRGVFKQSFAIPSVSPPIELRDDLFRDSPGSPGHSISSLKRSGMRNSPDDPVRLSK